MITKERLQEIAEDDFLKHGEAKAMARQLLAGLEQEPVADVVAWHHPTEERTCDIRLRRHDLAPGPLYAAPQLPQPAVVMTFDEWSRKCDLQLELCDSELREKARYIWDEASRAAMLEAAPQQEVKP